MENETTYQAVLGQVLVRKRRKKGLDQEALAKKVGVSRPTWSRIEAGLSAMNVEQMHKAAAALGTDPGALLVEADDVVLGLKKEGVKVHSSREDIQESKLQKAATVAFLGGLCLGGWWLPS